MQPQVRIPRQAYELPLLKSLVELGGSTIPADSLYRLIADKLGIAGTEMGYDPVHGRLKWVYDLQWVRHTLVKKGEIDGSQRGLWKITEKGRERVRQEWSGFSPADSRPSDEALPSEEPAEGTAEMEATDEGISENLAAKFVPESLEAVKGQILIDDTPINQIITIVNADRHLILTGPPGTGKTTIAINVCEQAVRTEFISGYILTTATSDWTTFDTIGGYMPRPDGELAFMPGIVLRSIRENKWLVIDEINRADVDKAFGQLLTTLSGQDTELPFVDSQGVPIRICRSRGLASYYSEQSATYCVGDNWRIIGTMNTFDKNSLFLLSYAFMRRFGFVHINNPSKAQLHSIIDGRVQDGHLATEDASRIKHLLEITPREIGPAILIDILNYTNERSCTDAFFESLVAYVLPQFEGLSVEAIVEFFGNVSGDLSHSSQVQMKQYMSEMFEIEPGNWGSL